jgi:uncharacterized glyoxalase superfamily protein PhnB
MKTKSVAPVLKVANIGKALAYYKDALGFEESFRAGNYAGVRLGIVELHLAEQVESVDTEYAKPIGGSTVYIFCDDVDHYYSEIRNRGAVSHVRAEELAVWHERFQGAGYRWKSHFIWKRGSGCPTVTNGK